MLTIPDVDKNVNNFFALLMGAWHAKMTLENSLAIICKVKWTSTLWHRNSTPGYLSKRNQNYGHKKMDSRMFIKNVFIIAPNYKQ